MASEKKSIFKKVVFVAGSIVSLGYLVSCLTPYINPVSFWPLTFLALVFPFLLAAMLVILILTLLLFRKYTWLVILTIALGYQNILAIIAFHPVKKFVQEKTNGTFRLVSWNVNDFLDSQIKNDTANNPRKQMFDFIKETNADVLCLQDFSDYYGKDFSSSFNYLKDSLGYAYTFFPPDYTNEVAGSKHQYGVAFFSRYPITDTGRIAYKDEVSTENFAYADIDLKGHSTRFYNAHLRSMQIHASTNAASEENAFAEADTALFFHFNTFRKLKQFDKIHVKQAQLIKSVLNNGSKPFIFCGDLNSVPSSYVYHHISSGLNDAFLCNGFGLGPTYDSISLSLRIDVVLFNKKIQTTQHYTPHLHLSDHYPNVADIEIE